MPLRIFSFLFFAIFLSQAVGQTVVKTFMFDSLERSYRLHVPPSYDGSEAVPLVFNFHGLNSSALVQEIYTQMSVASDSAGFIVIYPEGINERWNVNIDQLENDSIDDVGFVSALIDTMIQNYSIDANRIYAMGFSLGGFMSYRLACELSDRIAAITSVGGLMSQSLIDICDPQRVLSITHIHGTADDVVAYNGDREFVSVDKVMAYWRGEYQCELVPEVIPIPDTDPNDATIAVRYNYICAREPAELNLFTINGGGHTWPGGFPLPDQITNNDINASQEAWNFFKRHTLDNIPTNIAKEQPGSSIEVFPNPTNDLLTIQVKKTIDKLSLYNIQGKAVSIPFYIKGSDIQANLSALTKGMYILEVVIQGKMETFKVVKF